SEGRRVEARRLRVAGLAARRPGRHRTGLAADPLPGLDVRRLRAGAARPGRGADRLRDGNGPAGPAGPAGLARSARLGANREQGASPRPTLRPCRGTRSLTTT